MMLDMYVDADFASMWECAAEEQNPVRVNSGMGYVLLLAVCSFLWLLSSNLTLQPLEAEFIALSTGMRDLIPACLILQALGDAIWKTVSEKAQFTINYFWGQQQIFNTYNCP
jgi:hypothetical protein